MTCFGGWDAAGVSYAIIHMTEREKMGHDLYMSNESAMEENETIFID